MERIEEMMGEYLTPMIDLISEFIVPDTNGFEYMVEEVEF